MIKKLIHSLFIIFLCIFLVGCGNTENKEDINKNDNKTNNTQKEDKGSKEEQLLKSVGLTLEDIEPDEEYYRVKFDEDDEEFTFYMEKGTERNIGRYAEKIYNAGKKAAKDNKLYKASFNFYMNDGSAEEYIPKSASEINDTITYNYIDQFGYYYGNYTVTITMGAVSDMDGERNDDVYYPVYTISIGI